MHFFVHHYQLSQLWNVQHHQWPHIYVVEKNLVTKKEPLGVDAGEDRDDAAEDKDP